VYAYLDDLTVTGATHEEHDSNLKVLLDAVSSCNMTLNAKAQPGGAEGAQAPPLAIRLLMFIFLVIHQHCKTHNKMPTSYTAHVTDL